jgi:hypothetical protein
MTGYSQGYAEGYRIGHQNATIVTRLKFLAAGAVLGVTAAIGGVLYHRHTVASEFTEAARKKMDEAQVFELNRTEFGKNSCPKDAPNGFDVVVQDSSSRAVRYSACAPEKGYAVRLIKREP